MKKLSRPFDVLERHLTLRAYVLVQRFTVADLNIAAVMTLGAVRRTQPRRMAAHEGWLHECLFRPAATDWRDVAFRIPRPQGELGVLAMFV